MTDTELSGRALDEACARALGWTKPSERGRCDVCGWPLDKSAEQGCVADNCSMRPHPEPRADTVPQMQAPHMLDQKLRWLNSIVWLGGVHLTEKPRRHPAPPIWSAYAIELPAGAFARGEHDESKRWQFSADGESIHEATALLCVKVAAALRGQP